MITISATTRKKLLALPLILLAFLLALAVKNVSAQEAGALDLTVSPPVFELTASPGDQITETFRVRNNSAEPVELTVSARRLTSDPDSGAPIPESETNGEELSWVTFDPETFTAEPLEWTNIGFSINIPEDAAYGYYYVFSISPTSTSEQATTGAAVRGEVLVVALLTVQSEGSVSKAELVRFTPKNFITEYLPAEFEAEISNGGNVHVKPVGNIFITRGGSQEIAILDVNPGAGSVLPGGRRVFESAWTDGFLVKEPALEEDGTPKVDGNGNPQTKVSINWNKLTDFRVGPYTARLLLVYDDGTRDQTIEGIATFWVIPYTALAVMIGGAVILFFILRAVLRSYVRSQVKKSK